MKKVYGFKLSTCFFVDLEAIIKQRLVVESYIDKAVLLKVLHDNLDNKKN